MKFGICNLSIVPVRLQCTDTSELTTQLLYGDYFEVLEQKDKWSRIKIEDDKYEGWIDNKQFCGISKSDFINLQKASVYLSKNLIDYVTDASDNIFTIPMGSNLNALKVLDHKFEGECIKKIKSKSALIHTAFQYLNTPYLWGGKTPFGIDCSGLSQMVYRLNGFSLPRDAAQQATIGEVLSFIKETEPGDLAFFDNHEGKIVHVGILLENNYIIHAHGKVRIDRIDQSGIFNTEQNMHTHKLRVLKKII